MSKSEKIKNSEWRGRPEVVVPSGWVTVGQAAILRKVNYNVVYRMVKTGKIKHTQLEDRVILIPESELDKIFKHEPPSDRRRIPTQLSPNPARYDAWAKLAHQENVTVTELGYRYLDEAALKNSPEGIGCEPDDVRKVDLTRLRELLLSGAPLGAEDTDALVRLISEVERRRKLPPKLPKPVTTTTTPEA